MSSDDGAVLITGATGFVGMEVMERYLERSDRKIITLIRAKDDAAARERLDAVLQNLFGRGGERHAARVKAVAADMTLPGLGISRFRRERLAAETTTVIHSAASVSFALPLDEARAINYDGTRRMLEFAELAQSSGGLRRYGHISTAYVAGTHQGAFAECDLECGQHFHNSYEQSKYESEQLIRSHTDLPYTILRPSIVVGDRRSGWTACFNVLYFPLRAFSRGLFPVLPVMPGATCDVVSIDYVADAIHELCECPLATGETYHLTAGKSASTISEIAQLASRYFRRPLPMVLTPEQFAVHSFTESQRAAIEGSSAYFPYLSMSAVFDETRTRERLAEAGIEVTPLRDYMERLLDFATRSRWGKRPVSRVEALAA